MSREGKIVSVEYRPGPNLSPDEPVMYGKRSGRPLFIGDTVTEDDGAIVVVRTTQGANIPTAHIRVSTAVRL